ncbi:MAG TPA: 3-deoxy-7-phosphoheptulonate synthase, partial [Acidimicrobiales bacterium]|nr:3-deoxy-7-phosphoheptulonate synthase [Acidimicrobiales bacterium]
MDSTVPAASPAPVASWAPTSWRECTAHQQPNWPDSDAHQAVVDRLSTMPPLVFAGEARELTDQLAAVARGEA